LDVRIAGRVSVGWIAISGIAVVAARCCSSDGGSTDGAHCQRHAVASATIVAVSTAIATTHSDATVCDATAGTTNRNASIGNAAAAPVTAPSLCVANLRESAERKSRECHCRQNELLHYNSSLVIKR
jgi:hypothetical protein